MLVFEYRKIPGMQACPDSSSICSEDSALQFIFIVNSNNLLRQCTACTEGIPFLLPILFRRVTKVASCHNTHQAELDSLPDTLLDQLNLDPFLLSGVSPMLRMHHMLLYLDHQLTLTLNIDINKYVYIKNMCFIVSIVQLLTMEYVQEIPEYNTVDIAVSCHTSLY